MDHLTISSLPEWVEPSAGLEGSIDPLGFLAEADRIAESLLPGVTVVTTRIRYLSFLCWAIGRTHNDPDQIDRWEIALSVGEFLRHSNDGDEKCKFLGSRLLKEKKKKDSKSLRNGATRPDKLHQQTARILYSGLLRSCGLVDRAYNLSNLGRNIATQFGSCVGPKSIPVRNGNCHIMPCLSELTKYERRWLRQAFFDSDRREEHGEGAQRNKTLQELKKKTPAAPTNWTLLKNNGHESVLARYVGLAKSQVADSPAALLHRAASLELLAFPLTVLFLKLYEREGSVSGEVNEGTPFRAFRVRPDNPDHLISDVAAHLRYAGRVQFLDDELTHPSISGLKSWLLRRHRAAKQDDPWVHENWKQRRLGLMPARLPRPHQYRLSAFASLVSDLGW